jgi:hypothetical protein
MNANPVGHECQPCRALIWSTRLVLDDVRRNAWDVLAAKRALRAPGNHCVPFSESQIVRTAPHSIREGSLGPPLLVTYGNTKNSLTVSNARDKVHFLGPCPNPEFTFGPRGLGTACAQAVKACCRPFVTGSCAEGSCRQSLMLAQGKRLRAGRCLGPRRHWLHSLLQERRSTEIKSV